MGTEILQWNCRGVKANYENLELLILELNPKIICLQETFLKPTDSLTFENYSSVHKMMDSPRKASGGTSIFIRKDIPFDILNLNSNIQNTCCSISLQRTYIICNLYIPPSKSINVLDFDNLLTQIHSPFIILGDLNAHNVLWGSGHTDARGRLIERILFTYNLCILNDNSPTYLHPSTGTLTNIDLSICDPSIFLDFTSWGVHSDLCGSDHFPILISTSIVMDDQFPPNWRFNNVDWSSFANLCSIEINDDILDYVDPIARLTSRIIDIAYSTVPVTYFSKRRKSKPWFNENCKRVINSRIKALRNFTAHPTTQNLIIFKKCRAKAKKTIKKSKADAFKNYVSSISLQENSSKVWNMIRNFNGKNSSNLISHLENNNIKFTSKKDIANCLASTFSKTSSIANLSPIFYNNLVKAERTNINFTSDNSESYNMVFTFNELQIALHDSKPSSQGPDNIHYSFLKNFPRDSLNTLLNIYNYVWENNVFPDAWREAIIIPIPKPNKDKTNPISYRPIALTSCLCKVMERLVNNRLSWYLERNNIISSSQNGFRHRRNCIDHVVKLETRVREAFLIKHHIIAIFFDLEKAFDTTWRYGILRDLFTSGLRGNLPIFIRNFLHSRIFRVRVGDVLSDPFVQTMGVPQGSILSPLLFTIKVNSIVENLVPDVDSSLFVDDHSIYTSSPCFQVVEQRLQACLNKLVNWSNENGFKFSKEKTVLMHFNRFDNFPLLPVLKLGDFRIPLVKEVRFLGIIFDPKLSFIPHINNLKIKCRNVLNLLKVVSHFDWGADRLTLLTLYRSLLRSKLDYGCIVYGAIRKFYLRLLKMKL